MTGDQVKAARNELGMTLASFAFWLGLEGENGRRRIRAWESGKEPITGPAERAIKLALALHRLRNANPGENGWDDAMDEAEAALGRRSKPALGHSAGPR